MRRLPGIIPILLAVAAAALVQAQPADTSVKVDDFRYANDAAARAAWQPMSGTAPVSLAEVDGRRALRMPCNFRGTKIERASWDRSVRLDMTGCRAIQFAFFARDVSAVSHFSLYLQSGDGWYAASFGPETKSGWQTITIAKDETQIEGRPAGWASVSTIRISAWRGGDADAEFRIADLALVGGGGPIAVVRGESAARTSPGEVESVCQFTATVAGFLKDLGVAYAVVSDLDVTPERLKGVRLAILPHNPAMPDATAETLARFIDGGGKLIAFYALPGRLRGPLGVSGGEHVPQKYPGYFSTLRFEGNILPGAPRVVGQKSWNIQGVKAVEGRSRVAAVWSDQEGKSTGYPAVIVSDNGAYMTHVLLADDAAAKRRMMLAMVGRFVPEAWKQAAETAIARIGCFGRFANEEEATSAMADRVRKDEVPEPQVDAIEETLLSALITKAEARLFVQEAKYAEAMSAAEASRNRLIEAWCQAQAPQRGERRALWCHSAFGVSGMTWDEAAKHLADNGFTAIQPNMLWGGMAYYESKVLPVAPEVKEKGDQVALCLAACRKWGLECHVWKVNWYMGGRAPRDFVERMKKEGRTQVRFDGRPDDAWLCPSHPENRKLEVDSMVEVATKYDVDGIHFDYIRYPDADHCFCAGCRERFEQQAGVKVGNWPADARRDAALAAKWLDFRRANITATVAAVSEAVRKARPKCKISAAVFPNWPVDRDGVGQDWKLWCERSYLDFVCPMDYTSRAGEFEGLVSRQLGWAGKTPCYPGIGLSVWQPRGDVCKLIDFISITRGLKTGGFTVFEYGALEAREVVPLLGEGITRKQ